LKILLDTDIGSDIDDAVCLAYLLAHPECELLGITTVTDEAEKRAALASALCKVAGKDIPIFPGSEEPLVRDQQLQPEAPQAEALVRWPHQENFPKGQAVEFLRKTIRANPGEITLLTIGPLTNIGLLFKTDPEVARLLKGFVMMGGVFTNRLAGVGPLEWNAMGDPHATAIVYKAPVLIHRSIGLDVTSQVRMPAWEVNECFSHPLLLPVKDFARVWFQHAEGITFHDPLAAVTIFDPEVCKFERGRIEVELASQHLAGFTYWKPDETGPHETALEVNPGKFFDAYFSVFET
jgi:purine nucleosidase